MPDLTKGYLETEFRECRPEAGSWRGRKGLPRIASESGRAESLLGGSFAGLVTG